MTAIAELIARHLLNVLTYFTLRAINVMAEGLNSQVATVMKCACGCRTRDHLKIAVYFHGGGLNLYSDRATHAKDG